MVWGNHKKLFTYVEKMEDYKRNLYVCSFHMYRNIWEVAVEEVLDCERDQETLRTGKQWQGRKMGQ